MGKRVTVNAGVSALALPNFDGYGSYSGGDQPVLTDAEYSALNAAQAASVGSPTTVAEPARKANDPSATRDSIQSVAAGAMVLSVGFNEVTLTGNVTAVSVAADNPSASPVVYGAKPGSAAFVNVKIVQDGTGSRTITWGSSFKFAAATAPTLQTAANRVDFLRFVSTDGGTTWYETDRSLDLR